MQFGHAPNPSAATVEIRKRCHEERKRLAKLAGKDPLEILPFPLGTLGVPVWEAVEAELRKIAAQVEKDQQRKAKQRQAVEAYAAQLEQKDRQREATKREVRR